MKGILFLCIGNACRSQMAEGFARKMAPPGTEIYSAGSRPSGVVDPRTIWIMQEAGIDIREQKSKGLNAIPFDRIDLVINLCREEECPVFPRPVKRLSWNIADPGWVKGADEELLAAYRDTRDRIRALVETLFRLFVSSDNLC